MTLVCFMEKLPDYFYFTNGKIVVEEDKYKSKQWFDLKSITKLFFIFVLLDLNINLHAKVVDFIPSYQYKNIKLIDILNHTSGLENTWMVNGKSSALQQRYYSSHDIYSFALKLRQIPEQIGKYNYNNYSYNILALIVYEKTGKTWEKHLKNIFGSEAQFKTYKQYGLPYVAHSLFIRKDDIPMLSKIIIKRRFHSLILKHRLIPHTQKYYMNIVKGVKLTGHDGSGGQDLFFNDSQIFWVLSYGNPDIHSRGLTSDETKKIALKYL